jgi:hypothetical protein
VIPYATRTGTRRNLAALSGAGWRLLLTPSANALPPGFRYALDNGAWSAFQQQRGFDADAFRRLVDRFGPGADWIAVPDIVAAGMRSLAFSLSWVDALAGTAPLLIPVQDGMDVGILDHLPAAITGVFLGGSTEWKLATMGAWGAACRARGLYFHVARVNTMRRIYRCAAAGAQSFDGTSASRYAVTLPKLDEARRQGALVGCV